MKCFTCKKEKTDFWKDKSRKSGFRGDCVPCAKEKSEKFRIKNREINRKKSREKYHSNPIPDREKHLKRKYGISQSVFEEMFQEQYGKSYP